MKRPSFQFYPGDWLRSTDLRACSVGARGLWIDMICLMHEGNPYGYLRAGNKDILPTILARIVGASLSDVEGWLAELIDLGVCSIDERGCYLSRRMVRDEEIREKRASGGSRSQENPNVPKRKDTLKGYPSTPSLGGSPASSSASSSASAFKEQSKQQRATRLPKDWEPSTEGFLFCKAKRPDLNANETLERFKDYWCATTKTKVDWEATWRNWVRNEKHVQKSFAQQKEDFARDRFNRLTGRNGNESDHRTIDI